ncbi:hypothetical protein QPK87_20635 [Kamptonema cortianum]|jgi:hypothetical protein|nr:hypothetical protein [Kamptonema cortianum]
MIPRWEYLTLIVKADAKREVDFLEQRRSWKTGIPPYTPEAMIPELNALGAQGWELVHMQPVYAGDKEDILMHDNGGSGRMWTSEYFCVFKRPVSG